MKRLCMLLVVLFLCSLTTSRQIVSQQRVAVIGTGYVGLVTAAGLAEFGNQVTAVDINEEKILALQDGIIPIYEPGLERIVHDNRIAGRLTFTTDITQAIMHNDILVIAVGTPMADDGTADMTYIAAAMNMIANSINGFKVICMKSTVPVGTGAWIRQILEERGVNPKLFTMVSNPEFLREGSAVVDFLYPDRIVIGIENELAAEHMHKLYKALTDVGIPLVITSIPTSEMIKYASNAFLAVKVSFINEIANLCDALHADVKDVAYAMGLDKRINPYFLRPGPGFGGSCFPKDSSALLYTAMTHNVDLHVVAASLIANESQKELPVHKLAHLLDNDLNGKTIAVWGLAFKANTDDTRYSPALVTIERLLEAGAHVRVYDPAAMHTAQQEFPDIFYANDMYEAAYGADALIVMTEWTIFSNADLTQLKNIMHTPIIVDARGVFDPVKLHMHKYTFDCIGRSCIASAGLQ